MSKQLKITLSDEWYNWVEGEAIHRGQSESELFEDALTAFLAKLQADVEQLQQDAFHQKGFPAGLEAIFRDSARVTRRTWANPSIYCSLVDDGLCIIGGLPADGKDPHLPHPWTVTGEDFYATDWEVVD